MKYAQLEDRSLISISGADAEHLLENLITCKVSGLKLNELRFGALLSPQGKILFDFFIFRNEEGFIIDIDEQSAADFARRMMMYKLRADATISEPKKAEIAAVWNTDMPEESIWYQDPRHLKMGYRAYGKAEINGEAADFDAHRIELGIPRSGIDFELAGAYPHETLMDQFGGVDFRKGCFVGQEVVSRMQHRGTTKKRIVKVSATSELPQSSNDIVADGKPAGSLGTRTGTNGLALLRLDRVANAKLIEIDGIELSVNLPDWVDFSWPEQTA